MKHLTKNFQKLYPEIINIEKFGKPLMDILNEIDEGELFIY